MNKLPTWLKVVIAVVLVAVLLAAAQLMLYVDKAGDIRHGLG